MTSALDQLVAAGILKLLAKIPKERKLNLPSDKVVDANWVDNGPGWMALLLRSRDDLLNVRPNYQAISGLRVGLVAPCSGEAGDVDFEVRAFTAGGYEDPVTGSVNAGLAKWLVSANIAPSSYVAAQGTVLGRSGSVHVQLESENIWIGGKVVTCIDGPLPLLDTHAKRG